MACVLTVAVAECSRPSRCSARVRVLCVAPAALIIPSRPAGPLHSLCSHLPTYLTHVNCILVKKPRFSELISRQRDWRYKYTYCPSWRGLEKDSRGKNYEKMFTAKIRVFFAVVSRKKKKNLFVKFHNLKLLTD